VLLGVSEVARRRRDEETYAADDLEDLY
jgi:hypothetical protein